MPETPNVTLEQWRALMAVVDSGGYAQAAKELRKSQSSVTYAVQKLESLLGVRAFEIHGRKAVLTSTGQLLYRRARSLLEEALDLERASKQLSAGWEAEIRLSVEVIFPHWLLFKCLDSFGAESPHTRIELQETVIGGTPEALVHRRTDLAITPRVPVGFLGEPLMRLRFVPAAHPAHPLHKLGRKLTARDLRKHRHLVVRDSASTRTAKTTTVDVERRWTLSDMSSSIRAACMGYGFAWYPEAKIRDELASRQLAVLPMQGGAERWTDLYLVFPDHDTAGPGARRLAEILRDEVGRAV